MNNDYENIELSGPVDAFSISSVVRPECSDVGVSCYPDSVWIHSTGNLFYFLFSILFDNGLTFSLLDFFVVIRFHLQNF